MIVYSVSWLLRNWAEAQVLNCIKVAYSFVKENKTPLEVLCASGLYLTFTWSVNILRTFRKGLFLAGPSGMFYYNENNKPSKAKKSTRFLKQIALESITIKISGATGWDTFADANAPLNGLVRNCNDVKIILANPNSPDIKQRAEHVGQEEEEYRQEILNSIKFLKSLSGNPQKEIQLKCYNRYPTWKYIILQNHAWVQQYNQKKHVKNSTSYAFLRDQDLQKQDKVFNHIENQFMRRWKSSRLGKFNFETNELEYIDQQTNEKKTEKLELGE